MPDSHERRCQATVQIFAKYPHPGQVKTRLEEVLGEAGATSLYVELVVRQLTMVSSLPERFRVELWGDDSGQLDYYRLWLDKWPRLHFMRQSDGTLGDRMEYALKNALHHTGAVIQIGTDSPELTSDHLIRSVDSLSAAVHSVFIPAEDGGYVLGGYNVHVDGMFDRISWGSEKVMRQSLATLQRLGISSVLLEPLWDLDRPEDLERYRSIAP